MKAPEVQPDSDWTPLNLPFKIGSGRNFPVSVLRMAYYQCPIQGDNPYGIKDFDQAHSTHFMVGKCWFGEALEGPPRKVHGGVSAFVLDEAMGSAAWLNYFGVVARDIHVEFKLPTPIHKDLDVAAWVYQIRPKDVDVHAKVYDRQTGEVYSQSTGQFYRLAKEKLIAFSQQDSSQSHFDFTKIKAK